MKRNAFYFVNDLCIQRIHHMTFLENPKKGQTIFIKPWSFAGDLKKELKSSYLISLKHKLNIIFGIFYFQLPDLNQN